MRVIRGLPAAADVPVALTIGNFDGVHRGHQAMLARLIEGAEDLRLVPAVLTFDPHPREFFAPHAAPPRLSSLRTRLEAFRRLGVQRTIVARFDRRMAALAPEQFIADVLVRALDVRWVLVGDDFRFGQGRRGDLALLRAHVVDFLLFHWREWHYPAFNVADSAITCGAAALILDSFRQRREHAPAAD